MIRAIRPGPAPDKDTYLCSRCGVKRAANPGRKTTTCRDCQDVTKDLERITRFEEKPRNARIVVAPGAHDLLEVNTLHPDYVLRWARRAYRNPQLRRITRSDVEQYLLEHPKRTTRPRRNSSMTKLASALPDGHGLESVRHKLIDNPRAKHVAIVVVDCAKVTIDYEKGGKEPTAAIRTIEVVHPEDLTLTQQILTRGRDKRLGATVLPLDVEDDISHAFTGRSEDYTTDLANDTAHLDDDQVKALAASLDRPLRHELSNAIHALRSSKEWVTLGRARRVLQIAIRRLEENDKRLLRDDDGNLVDPETGDVVDEDQITSEDLDRMLQTLFDKGTEQQELDLDEPAETPSDDEPDPDEDNVA